MANGQSADENQVSSTSSLRFSSVEPHSSQAEGSSSTQVTCPSAHSHRGSWCPHQICREMHQSGAFSSESIAKRCCDSGWYRTRRSRSAASAGCFSSSILHHHWSEISGSIRLSQRSQSATEWR